MGDEKSEICLSRQAFVSFLIFDHFPNGEVLRMEFKMDPGSGKVVNADHSIKLGRGVNPGPSPAYSYDFVLSGNLRYFRATRQVSGDGKKLVIAIDYPHLRRALEHARVPGIDQMVAVLRQAVITWEAAINESLVKRGDWSVEVLDES